MRVITTEEANKYTKQDVIKKLVLYSQMFDAQRRYIEMLQQQIINFEIIKNQ